MSFRIDTGNIIKWFAGEIANLHFNIPAAWSVSPLWGTLLKPCTSSTTPTQTRKQLYSAVRVSAQNMADQFNGPPHITRERQKVFWLYPAVECYTTSEVFSFSLQHSTLFKEIHWSYLCELLLSWVSVFPFSLKWALPVVDSGLNKQVGQATCWRCTAVGTGTGVNISTTVFTSLFYSLFPLSYLAACVFSAAVDNYI